MHKSSTFHAVLVASLASAPAGAVTFKHAFQGDLKSLDPYTLNETFSIAMQGNVYEGLTHRDSKLTIVPGLAESWEVLEPTRWRFHLRKGVKFAGGEPFAADDVVFSFDRVRQQESEFKTRVPSDATIVKVDDYTVDFVLKQPNPTLHAEWDTWYIMSKSWAEQNGATKVQPATGAGLNAFALKSDGTGALYHHEPRAWRPHDLQEEPGLVGLEGRAGQCRRGRLHDDQAGRDARRRTSVGRGRHDRAGARAGHAARGE